MWLKAQPVQISTFKCVASKCHPLICDMLNGLYMCVISTFGYKLNLSASNLNLMHGMSV